jgi:hypothetical protein
MSTNQALDELAGLLYGGGGDELVAKLKETLSPDEARKKRERTQARVGLASNVIGLTAGLGGTAAALRDPRLKKGKLTRKLYAAGKKIPAPISSKGGKVGAALAGGALGLQLANIGGDVVANRVLNRAAKADTPKPKAPKPMKVSKGLVVPIVTTSVSKANPDGADLVSHPGQAFKRSKHELKLYATKEAIKGGKKSLQIAQQKGPVAIEAGKKAGSKGWHAFINKADEDALSVTWEGEFSKVDADKQQVFGWASVVELNGEPIVDLQGDYISPDEMEKSAYEYVIKSRKGGDMHLRDEWNPVQKSEMIESFIVTPEKKAAMGIPDSVPTGWWVGFQVRDPQVWAKVKSGERTGFSIHGRGHRSPGSM